MRLCAEQVPDGGAPADPAAASAGGRRGPAGSRGEEDEAEPDFEDEAAAEEYRQRKASACSLPHVTRT